MQADDGDLSLNAMDGQLVARRTQGRGDLRLTVRQDAGNISLSGTALVLATSHVGRHLDQAAPWACARAAAGKPRRTQRCE